MRNLCLAALVFVAFGKSFAQKNAKSFEATSDTLGIVLSYKTKMIEAVEKIKKVQDGSATSEKIHEILKGERTDYKKAKNELNQTYSKAIQEIRGINANNALVVRTKIKEAKGVYLKNLDQMIITRNNKYEIIYSGFEFKPFRFFPSRNSKFSSMYHNELKENSSINFLRNQFMSFGEDYGAISSEIISGHLGAVRLGLSTAIAKVKIEDINAEEIKGLTNEQLQQLAEEQNKKNMANGTLANVVAGGGLLSIKGQYPIFNINGNIPYAFKMDSEVTGNISGTFASLGTSIPESEADMWWSMSSETRAFLPIKEFADDNSFITTFGLFAEYDIRKISGTDTFFSNLQIEHSFWLSEFKIGIFASGIQISYSNLRFSNSDLDNRYENRITLAFAPNENK